MSTNTGKTLKKIDELREALSFLLAEDLAGLPPAGQLQCLQALRPAVCQLQALQLCLVGVVDANASARTQGSASTATWLRNTLHAPKAAELVKSAAALSRMPLVAAAFAAGQINDAHVATIAKVAETVPPGTLVNGTEELLVQQAAQLTPSKFGPVATRIRDQAVPRAAPKPEPPTRWLRTQRRANGVVLIRGSFDPDSGGTVLTALTASSASGVPGQRSTEVEQAEALLDLCRRAVIDRHDGLVDEGRSRSRADAGPARRSGEGPTPGRDRVGPGSRPSPHGGPKRVPPSSGSGLNGDGGSTAAEGGETTLDVQAGPVPIGVDPSAGAQRPAGLRKSQRSRRRQKRQRTLSKARR